VSLAAALAVSGVTPDADPSGTPAIEPLVESVTPLKAERRVRGKCAAGDNWGFRRDDLALEVARIVNRYRSRVGLRRLKLEFGLMRSAIWKAQHMAHFFYFEHADPAPPVSRGVPQRLAACGFVGDGSENIAYGFETPQGVVHAWLRSPGHRRNIRSRTWHYLGVGVAESRHGGFFWAQNFG
jgi:uncharacterized protein YkwD